jgi:hypothetical protein
MKTGAFEDYNRDRRIEQQFECRLGWRGKKLRTHLRLELMVRLPLFPRRFFGTAVGPNENCTVVAWPEPESPEFVDVQVVAI